MERLQAFLQRKPKNWSNTTFVGTRPRGTPSFDQNNLYEQINEQNYEQHGHLDHRQHNARHQAQIHDHQYEQEHLDHRQHKAGHHEHLGYQKNNDDDFNRKQVQENQQREDPEILNQVQQEKQKSPRELEAERNVAKTFLGEHEQPSRFEKEIMACLPNLMSDTYENRIQVVEEMMNRLNIPHEDISTRKSNRLQQKKAEINLENLPLLEMKRLTVNTGPAQENDHQTVGLGDEEKQIDQDGAVGGDDILKVSFEDEQM